jgi:FkbM family methyltransferase
MSLGIKFFKELKRKYKMTYSSLVSSKYGQIIIPKYDTTVAREYAKGIPQDDYLIFLLGKLLKSLNRKVTIFDVGANVGSFSLAFNHILNQNCEIHLFEAQRILSYMISGTMALNGFENVYSNFKAVSDKDGEKIKIPKFDYNAPNSFGSIEFGNTQREPLTQTRDYASEFETVDSITLDTYIKNNSYIKSIDFVKIDIEGMEIFGLDGFSLIQKFKPILFIEHCKCGLENVKYHPYLVDYKFMNDWNDVMCVHKDCNPDSIFKLMS